jgi:hypothetical protein
VLNPARTSGLAELPSLEKVPPTGRWRFMPSLFDPDLEHALAVLNRKELCDLQTAGEYSLLPSTHPFVCHVKDIVRRILHANHLGVLMDDPDEEAFLWASAREAEEMNWRPYFTRTITSSKRRWLVSVIDSDTVFAFGEQGTVFLPTQWVPHPARFRAADPSLS